MLQARKHVSSPIIWQREQQVSTQANKNAKHLANSNTDKAGRKNWDGQRQATTPVILVAKERHQIYQHSAQKLLLFTSWKVPKYGAISGPHLPAFGLNTEKYFGSPRIQPECGKIRTRNNSAPGHFSRSGCYRLCKTRVTISTVLNLVCFGFFVEYMSL